MYNIIKQLGGHEHTDTSDIKMDIANAALRDQGGVRLRDAGSYPIFLRYDPRFGKQSIIFKEVWYRNHQREAWWLLHNKLRWQRIDEVRETKNRKIIFHLVDIERPVIRREDLPHITVALKGVTTEHEQVSF